MSRRLAAALACLLWVAGCGEVESDPERCRMDAIELDKRWFFGELDTDADDPLFALRVSVVAVESDSPALPAFAGTETEHEARFMVHEDFLVVRTTGNDARIIAAFPIVHHRSADCSEPHKPGVTEELPPPGSQPWYLRPWFRVDWSRNLGVVRIASMLRRPPVIWRPPATSR